LAHAIALEVVTPSLSQGSAAKTAPKSCKKYFQANRSGASLTGRSRGRRTFPIASEIPSAAPLNFGVRPSRATKMPAPFYVYCNTTAPLLYERSDGSFQIIEQVGLAPFMAGYGHLLVEHALAEYLQALDVERVVYEPVLLVNPATKQEHRTHTRIRVRQFFKPDQLHDLCLDGLRMLTLNEQFYFASPDLKLALEARPFPYLRFREGLNEFAA
jgi:hypothetical protein